MSRCLLPLLLFVASISPAQQGELQIHFMDVGQADAAVLISPGGEIVAFDLGEDLVHLNCDKPLSYLQQLGVDHIDYLILSHYHQDHLGCVPEVLSQYPLKKQAIDRGGEYHSTYYTRYVDAVRDKRTTAIVGQHLALSGGVDIEILALNARGTGTPEITTTNENDLSVSARVSFGAFHAEIGGDLSGDNTANYRDVESGLAQNVGLLDVYKVHHHCSSHSSNDAWLSVTRPAVAIISDGDGNSYGHPAPDCIERLHAHGVHLYLTEQGADNDLDPTIDIVAKNIIVTVDSNGYSVQHGTEKDQYAFVTPGNAGNPAPTSSPLRAQYAWSQKSHVYHFANCDYVRNIHPNNLQTGPSPPPDKTLHVDCPIVRSH
jgi:beta-lactamase superfamily II metal-dependent hydrolase